MDAFQGVQRDIVKRQASACCQVDENASHLDCFIVFAEQFRKFEDTRLEPDVDLAVHQLIEGWLQLMETFRSQVLWVGKLPILEFIGKFPEQLQAQVSDHCVVVTFDFGDSVDRVVIVE